MKHKSYFETQKKISKNDLLIAAKRGVISADQVEKLWETFAVNSSSVKPSRMLQFIYYFGALFQTKAELSKIQRLLKHALEEIARLKEQIKSNSNNSSKPPSTDQKGDTINGQKESPVCCFLQRKLTSIYDVHKKHAFIVVKHV